MPRGYGRALYILLFVHRGSFQAKMFGWKSPLSEAQVELFEWASHLSSEVSDHTRSGHYPQRRPDTCS